MIENVTHWPTWPRSIIVWFKGLFISGVSAAGILALTMLLIYQPVSQVFAGEAAGSAVGGRDRPDFESFGLSLRKMGAGPSGIANGRFRDTFGLYGQLEFEAGYETNILRSETDEISSSVFVVRPKLALRSDWDNHALAFILKGEATRFGERANEATDDIAVRVAGKLDISEDRSLSGYTEIAKAHGQRGREDDLGELLDPVTYQSFAIQGTYTDQGGDLMGYSIGAGYAVYKYDDLGSVSLASFDRQSWNLSPSFTFSRGGMLSFVVEPSYQQVDYAESSPTDRDSLQFGLGIGFDWDYSGVSGLNFRIGATQRDFSDSSLDDQTDLLLLVDGVWNVTPIFTLSGTAKIANQDTRVSGQTSKTVQSLEVRADYELRDNVILGARFAHDEEIFNGAERTDAYEELSAYARYLINEHLFIGAEVKYEDSSSDSAGSSYSNVTTMFRFGTKFCCLAEGGVISAFD
ncbi:MAG: outer membrane beta-barrel protein [Rhodospirillaceae bacterium]|jgi:hypothetical protein|nr:outer membrane beta-barrel protein [Rhodospirillaceae bacterium]